ncbi:hypothetical protein [Nevskia sp.]|uniref:hypothetical protein n=1 Tax=Nevskia sp. TaxID=1929292 RepID=UPI0025FFC884|nr:hypothetical protein [Nevskia sp.]
MKFTVIRAVIATTFAALLLGGFLMASVQGSERRKGAAPMTGPDFLIVKIKSYDQSPDRDGLLHLQDGGTWRVLIDRGDYIANSAGIGRAMRSGLLFISGDERTRIVDRIDIPRPLSAISVGPLKEGRYAVSFAGPPSIYYLVGSRPWAAAALALLQDSVAKRPPFYEPDLLVSSDIVTSEIMDVRPAP